MAKMLCVGILIALAAVIGLGVWNMFPGYQKIKGITLTVCEIALAMLATGYAVCRGAHPLAWDLPTRMATAGWLFPVWNFLGTKFERYRIPVFWGLNVVFGILFALTVYKF